MGRGHGATRGGGAGGGLSDAAINSMARNIVPGTTLNPNEIPELMTGEIMINTGWDYDKKHGWAMNARVPEIENRIQQETGAAPAQPSSKASNKVKEKYLKDYDTYHDRYMSAMTKGISDYKKVLGKTKNSELRALLADKITTYTKWKNEASGIKDWIHKAFRPR